MSTPIAGKICVSCGEDVAGKPRTKDARGRYYCQPCYQKLAQKHARRESMPMPKAPPAARPGLLDLPDDVAAPDAHVLQDLIGDVPAAAPMAMVCPGCRLSIPSGSVLCTHCGYNLQTGTAIGQTHVQHAKPSGAVWRGAIGGISLVLGACGAVLYGINLVRVLNSGAEGTRLIGGIGGAGLTISLSLWLLVAGLNIVRKQATGVAQIKRWAIVKLALCVVCFAPAMLLAAAALSRSDTRLPEELQGLGSALTAYLLLLVAWLMFWPIFVLAWFSRAAVKSDVDGWN
jgi:hypothetical protein